MYPVSLRAIWAWLDLNRDPQCLCDNEEKQRAERAALSDPALYVKPVSIETVGVDTWKLRHAMHRHRQNGPKRALVICTARRSKAKITARRGLAHTWLALGKSCLGQFMLCMMVVWNCPFGPNEDEAWMNTLGECIKHIRQHFLLRDVPIWQDAAVEIERQLEAEGVELPGLDSSEVELFHYSLDSTFAASGARCNQARFQACIATCEKNLGHWHVDRTVRTAFVCCLSCL